MKGNHCGLTSAADGKEKKEDEAAEGDDKKKNDKKEEKEDKKGEKKEEKKKEEKKPKEEAKIQLKFASGLEESEIMAAEVDNKYVGPDF